MQIVTRLCGLCGLAALAILMTPGVQAADNLRLHGALVHEACDIQPGDEAQTLELGMVADRFIYLNTRTPSRVIRFNLINCDTSIGNMVTVKFMGVENIQLPGYLALDGSSTASGIGIGIETPEGQLIALNGAGATYPIVDGANVVAVKGFIRGEPDALANRTIVLGAFSAVTTFSLDYN
ncbi:fimbrial protein [Enterobacter cloacae]|uniref:fimbrial protein n=1 Tax=Enterobacter cloacae TaxID=550 RepID=UPI002541AB31|nr:fimbrial protein [Enterobacter cloacae]WIF62920.1 fimbrial protein [Enterobacter cloacae]